MDILSITSSRIGDAVLSTGLLDHIARKYPKARVSIVCGPLAASLFEGYPNLHKLMPLRKKPHNAHWLDFWLWASRTRWDAVIDLRNSLAARFLLMEKRFTMGRGIDRKKHKVEQNAAVLKLSYTPAPKLWFTERQKQDAQKFVPDAFGAARAVLAVAPAANWFAKTWPADRFIDVIQGMAAPGGVLAGARVAVFAAPGEENVARPVLESIPAERRLDMIVKTDPGTAAAALARASFFIGNDSGLMHCAAAVGVKTLGLFGPGWPEIYRPWGSHAAFVQTPKSFDELTAYKGYTPQTAPCLMEGLGVEEVKAAVRGMFAKEQ